MGALRESSSEPFVGQVLGRASPVLEFKAAPGAPDSHARLKPHDANDAKRSNPSTRAPADSEVRVTRKPTLRIDPPVLPRIVHHTRGEWAERTVRGPVTWVARQVSHAAIAIAGGLAVLTAVTITARAASWATYATGAAVATFVAEPLPTKEARDPMHLVGEPASDVFLGAYENAVFDLPAPPRPESSAAPAPAVAAYRAAPAHHRHAAPIRAPRRHRAHARAHR